MPLGKERKEQLDRPRVIMDRFPDTVKAENKKERRERIKAEKKAQKKERKKQVAPKLTALPPVSLPAESEQYDRMDSSTDGIDNSGMFTEAQASSYEDWKEMPGSGKQSDEFLPNGLSHGRKVAGKKSRKQPSAPKRVNNPITLQSDASSTLISPGGDTSFRPRSTTFEYESSTSTSPFLNSNWQNTGTSYGELDNALWSFNHALREKSKQSIRTAATLPVDPSLPTAKKEDAVDKIEEKETVLAESCPPSTMIETRSDAGAETALNPIPAVTDIAINKSELDEEKNVAAKLDYASSESHATSAVELSADNLVNAEEIHHTDSRIDDDHIQVALQVLNLNTSDLKEPQSATSDAVLEQEQLQEFKITVDTGNEATITVDTAETVDDTFDNVEPLTNIDNPFAKVDSGTAETLNTKQPIETQYITSTTSSLSGESDDSIHVELSSDSLLVEEAIAPIVVVDDPKDELLDLVSITFESDTTSHPPKHKMPFTSEAKSCSESLAGETLCHSNIKKASENGEICDHMDGLSTPHRPMTPSYEDSAEMSYDEIISPSTASNEIRSSTTATPVSSRSDETPEEMMQSLQNKAIDLISQNKRYYSGCINKVEKNPATDENFKDKILEGNTKTEVINNSAEISEPKQDINKDVVNKLSLQIGTVTMADFLHTLGVIGDGVPTKQNIAAAYLKLAKIEADAVGFPRWYTGRVTGEILNTLLNSKIAPKTVTIGSVDLDTFLSFMEFNTDGVVKERGLTKAFECATEKERKGINILERYSKY